MTTVTAHSACSPPSTVFTTIVAWPAPTAETVPSAETVATAGLVLLQLKVVTAFSGKSTGSTRLG